MMQSEPIPPIGCYEPAANAAACLISNYRMYSARRVRHGPKCARGVLRYVQHARARRRRSRYDPRLLIVSPDHPGGSYRHDAAPVACGSPRLLGYPLRLVRWLHLPLGMVLTDVSAATVQAPTGRPGTRRRVEAGPAHIVRLRSACPPPSMSGTAILDRPMPQQGRALRSPRRLR